MRFNTPSRQASPAKSTASMNLTRSLGKIQLIQEEDVYLEEEEEKNEDLIDKQK
jgi:hypothetical protein